MDTMYLMLMQLPIIAIVLLAFIYYRRIKNDTVQQQFGSSGSHQQDQEIPGKDESGSVICNQFAINHGQKSGNSKTSTTSKGHQTRNSGNSGGNGGINKRHDNKTHTHPWLVTSLKGHTDEIRDIGFSSNGKFLASCAEDRSILIWSCAQLEDGKNRKTFRINIEFDSAVKLAWNPDDKTIAVQKMVENSIETYKLEKKDGWFYKPSKGFSYPKVTDKDIVGFGISCTGRFMMSCNNATDLYLWDLKGNQLDKIDTYLMNTYSARISPCGRFVAACGFAPDCKVWEVKFAKNGEYQKMNRAFDLSGHTSGIYDVAFDQDTSHMATVSKDGTWKLFNTRIEYDKGQSPRCLKTGKYTQRPQPSLIALSLNAEVIAIASGNTVELFSGRTGECDCVIKNIHEGGIVAITFDPVGKFFFTAGDKHVRMYHNVTGYKESIAIMEAKLKTNLTSATQERLEKQIDEYVDFLKKYS